MRVRNMTSRNGNKIPNQFIIEDEGKGALGNFKKKEVFQSYDSIIAVKITWDDRTDIELDSKYWNFSNTTGKYRNLFLNESKKETQHKIDSGEYKLVDLNK